MKAQDVTRREFLKSVSGAAALAGTAFLAPSVPLIQDNLRKPRHRFSIDPFEVQKEGVVVYTYGTHESSTPRVGVDAWFRLQGHNFAGCRDYPVRDKKHLSRKEVREHWEKQKVVPVFMAGADPKAGADKVRQQWEEAVKEGYKVLSIDEFYPKPRTPVAYDKAVQAFKMDHPDIYVQVWEANFPEVKPPFPHLEILTPYIDAYMPEIYWKWFKDDASRRKLFRSLIDRAKKAGALKKLLIGLGTHDVPNLKHALEDIPAILDMEPNIGGFAFFIHNGEAGEEYDKLHEKLDKTLRDLFAA